MWQHRVVQKKRPLQLHLSARVAMAGASQFKSELGSMQNLLVQQRSLLPAHDFDKVQAIQAAAFAKRARSLSGLDSDTVQSVTDLLKQGPWSSQQQSDLALALCESMTHGAAAGKKPEARHVQEMKHFQFYLTAPEAVLVSDPHKPMVVKVDTVVNRLLLFFCTSLQ